MNSPPSGRLVIHSGLYGSVISMTLSTTQRSLASPSTCSLAIAVKAIIAAARSWRAAEALGCVVARPHSARAASRRSRTSRGSSPCSPASSANASPSYPAASQCAAQPGTRSAGSTPRTSQAATSSGEGTTPADCHGQSCITASCRPRDAARRAGCLGGLFAAEAWLIKDVFCHAHCIALLAASHRAMTRRSSDDTPSWAAIPSVVASRKERSAMNGPRSDAPQYLVITSTGSDIHGGSDHFRLDDGRSRATREGIEPDDIVLDAADTCPAEAIIVHDARRPPPRPRHD